MFIENIFEFILFLKYKKLLIIFFFFFVLFLICGEHDFL